MLTQTCCRISSTDSATSNCSKWQREARARIPVRSLCHRYPVLQAQREELDQHLPQTLEIQSRSRIYTGCGTVSDEAKDLAYCSCVASRQRTKLGVRSAQRLPRLSWCRCHGCQRSVSDACPAHRIRGARTYGPNMWCGPAYADEVVWLFRD